MRNLSNLYIDGVVGIGTTSTSYKLSVVGTSHSWNVSPHANGIDLYSTGNVAPHYQTTFDWYTGAPGSGSFKMRLDSSGNLGIGTTTPAQKLHVLGSARVTGDFELTGANPRIDFNFNSSDALRFYDSANSTERMRLTSGGSLLIGTTTQSYNPQTQGYLLGVKSNVSQAFISIAKSGQTLDDQGMIVGLDSTTGYVWMRQSVALTFGTNNTPRVTITSTGNVGIGTTAPNSWAQLETTGTVAVGGILYLKSSGKIQGLSAFPGSASTLSINPDGGNVGIGTTNPSAKLDVNGTISSKTGTGSAYSIGVLEITSNGTPSQIKITTAISFGGVTNAHSVTIRGFQYGSANTADLQISWHVYNNSFYNRTATSSGGWAPTIRLAVENGYVVIHLTSPGYWPKLYVESLYNAFGGTSQAQGWSWADAAINPDANTPNEVVPYKVNFGNSFVMDSSGNVGIGTTSPANQLHIVSASNNSSALIIQDDARRLQLGRDMIEARSSDGTTVQNLYIQPNGNVGISTSAGNVGIGTTSPSKKLHVSGDSQFDAGGSGQTLLLGRANGQPTIKAQTDNGGYLILDSTSNFMSLNHYVGQNIVLVNGGGKVGIGTTSPGGALDVQQSSSGNILARVWNTNTAGTGSSSIRIANSGNNNDGARLEFSDSQYYVATISGDRNQGLVFRTSANGTSPTGISERMRITSSGNVLIGTTTDPGYKLNVNGTSTFAGDVNINNNKITNVGTIGRNDSAIYFEDTDAYRCVRPNDISVGSSDGLISLGWSNNRWKDIYLSGQVNANGGNSANWNTAYGWGNHASAGYLTSYTETDTLATVTGRGATTGTLITLTKNDVALKAQENGTGTAWRGRIGTFNATADTSAFLGNYNSRAGVFGHNNALTAWDDLWVNTLGVNGQGNLYLSWNTYVKGNSSDTNYTLWHSGNLTNLNQLTNGPGYITSSALSGYATETYVNTAVANLVDSAPGTLDTLNELAAALGDDPNFATTVTNSIATKLPLAGGTLTGDLVIGTAAAASTTNAFGTFTQLVFDNSYNDAPRGPNKIQVHNNGTTWAAGIGVHDGTVAYYTGSTHKWYKSTSQTSFTEVMNLSDTGVLYLPAGNSGQWNTAYGWGNHASAGYALSTDLANYMPLSGGTFSGPVVINGSLTVNGTITESSSIKIKENVVEIGGSLEKVNSLRPVSYNKIGSQNTELGLIAEEVQNTYPEFVQYDENGEPVGVNYSRLTVALIGAVQELTKRIEQLENNG